MCVLMDKAGAETRHLSGYPGDVEVGLVNRVTDNECALVMIAVLSYHSIGRRNL